MNSLSAFKQDINQQIDRVIEKHSLIKKIRSIIDETLSNNQDEQRWIILDELDTLLTDCGIYKEYITQIIEAVMSYQYNMDQIISDYKEIFMYALAREYMDSDEIIRCRKCFTYNHVTNHICRECNNSVYYIDDITRLGEFVLFPFNGNVIKMKKNSERLSIISQMLDNIQLFAISHHPIDYYSDELGIISAVIDNNIEGLRNMIIEHHLGIIDNMIDVGMCVQEELIEKNELDDIISYYNLIYC